MKWSWRIARIAGIDVYMHATFLLLLLWVALSQWQEYHTLDATLEGVAFILVLFGCVVMHEFGHSLTARRFGIRTRDITLYPIGGVASLESMPEKPIHEILVALAGPAVNFIISGCIWAWMVHQQQDPVAMLTGDNQGFLVQLMEVNVFLALFNLLPAFPTDGGRVLRALLAFGLDRIRATTYAVRVGQVFSILFALLSFIVHAPMLLLVAIVLWFGGTAELNIERMKSLVKHVSVRQAMLREFHVLSLQDTLAKAVEITLQSAQHDFPIRDGEQFAGVLTHRTLLQALVDMGADTSISQVPLARIGTADINEPLHKLLQDMQESGIQVVVITERGQLAGLVTLENLLELFALHNAMMNHGVAGKPQDRQWM